jgi:glycine cleavage system H protein
MTDLRFTRDHEWVRRDGDAATVGITDYAQNQLGDVVYVELPAIGKTVEQGGEAAIVESVKAASEIYAPIAGEIVAVNQLLTSEPAKVNADPQGDGWFFTLKPSDPAQLDKLMDEASYQAFLESLA